MSHALKMMIGCVLPFILIFLLPVFGVSDDITFFVFFLLMFGCHLLMMGSHKKHE